MNVTKEYGQTEGQANDKVQGQLDGELKYELQEEVQSQGIEEEYDDKILSDKLHSADEPSGTSGDVRRDDTSITDSSATSEYIDDSDDFLEVDQSNTEEAGEDMDMEREHQSSSEPVDENQDVTGNERNKTFEKAESYFSRSKLDLALQCYLQCVKGIERGSGFLYLPQCLHQIAECYHLKDEDEKAIQFLKAEKIYYETALIDTQHMQKKIEEIAGGEDNTVTEELESEILRAVEYENLAKLCLEKHQTQLALEFSGKATKLYQKHYGDDHKTTQRCLDLFTSVYAEVGKEEYTAKLSAYETESAGTPASTGQDGDNEEKLRHRKPLKGKEQTTEAAVQSPMSMTTHPQGYAEETSCCCLSLLWITLIFCTITAVILISIVYCKLTPTSWTCHWCRVQYRYLSHQIGFLAYKFTKS